MWGVVAGGLELGGVWRGVGEESGIREEAGERVLVAGVSEVWKGGYQDRLRRLGRVNFINSYCGCYPRSGYGSVVLGW